MLCACCSTQYLLSIKIQLLKYCGYIFLAKAIGVQISLSTATNKFYNELILSFVKRNQPQKTAIWTTSIVSKMSFTEDKPIPLIQSSELTHGCLKHISCLILYVCQCYLCYFSISRYVNFFKMAKVIAILSKYSKLKSEFLTTK